MKATYDIVRQWIPDASDDLCEYILWEKTCYPLGGLERIEHQIREACVEYRREKAEK